jgi:uncharacterized membrane protein
MEKKIFLFFLFFSFVYAQDDTQWPGVDIICKSADYFSTIILILGLLYVLKVGYKLISSHSVSDFSSEKRTLTFVLLGLAFATTYLTIFKNISGIQDICP